MVKSFLYLPSQGSLDSADKIKGGIFSGQYADDVAGKDLIAKSDLPHFHIGQSYEKKPAQAIRCALCGENKFNVGRGSFYTAIKCVHCEWELCIHDG